MDGRHGHPASHRERPAGTETATVSSAGAAYDSIIGASQAQSNYNVNGSGMTVAVIDTGIDSNNPAFAGSKVIASYDFSNPSDSNPPEASNAESTSSPHGTGVAGLIASDDPSDPGVAPGADLVDLKVTDASGTASLQSIANALQWVVNNHAQYNITVVNLSLSDGQNYAQNWFATGGGVPEQVTNLIGQLRAMNIPVVVATGNNYDGQQGEGFAAIVAGTISVTATNLSGQLLPDAQRLGASVGGASATVIAAPGDQLTVPMGDSGQATAEGTSFATPLVSGAIVLLQQIYQQRFGTLPTVDQLQSWLQQGADPISDPADGITIGQLDIPKAAALIPAAASQAPAPSQPAATVQVSTASVVPSTTTAATATQVLVTATPSNPAPSNPTPTPVPTPTPAPVPVTPPAQAAPAPATYQVFNGSSTTSTAGSTSGSDVSGLAQLLHNMRIWQASRD